eukprot:scaffold9345_cov120-Cylindrotheca_fusiformis.AAC.21
MLTSLGFVHLHISLVDRIRALTIRDAIFVDKNRGSPPTFQHNSSYYGYLGLLKGYLCDCVIRLTDLCIEIASNFWGRVFLLVVFITTRLIAGSITSQLIFVSLTKSRDYGPQME